MVEMAGAKLIDLLIRLDTIRAYPKGGRTAYILAQIQQVKDNSLLETNLTYKAICRRCRQLGIMTGSRWWRRQEPNS